ncbi:hypothetical protein [Legionella sp. 16cNR16C]|uniref:hypothetical protein n=1 Tax=Legionella sp. 16cNR16C TaxID=2905656 RepID=UPI001E4B756C|nr:hypothetical protein [Legionella sp. 16cNR16C]MCE3044524.1 hypothetical protein [Legionella sp. 16cNR16C]
MPNQFVDSLLAKADLPALLIAYQSDKPDISLLSKLVDDLAQQHSFDLLETLLKVIETGGSDDRLEVITTRISIHFLSQILERDQQQALKASFDRINETPDLWPQCLLALSTWIKSGERRTALTSLLSILSNTQRETLYAALTDRPEKDAVWLGELIGYILKNESLQEPEAKAHLQRLSSCLLLSAAEIPAQSINSLSLLLEDEELIDSILKLRAIASTYAKENQEAHGRFASSRQTYLNKYENLIQALAIRAKASESAYQKIIADRPNLANWLMIARLKSSAEKPLQESLVSEVLTHYSLFNWEDTQFVAEVIPVMVAVSKAASGKELFKQFFKRDKLNTAFCIRFLSEYYKQTEELEQLLQFVKDISRNTPDQSFTINFLTQNSGQSQRLTESLLHLLELEQLIPICSHILALQQIFHPEESLCKQYCRVLCEKLKSSANQAADCKRIAQTIAILPKKSRAQPLELISSHLNGFTKLSMAWLSALFETDIKKVLLFPFLLNLIRTISAKEQQQLLELLSKEEFYRFYIHLLRNQNTDEKFTFLSDYLKKKDKHSFFEYLILLTPQVHQEILDAVLPELEPAHLIQLIISLIRKSKQDSSYLAPLHQLLIQFCTRMQATLDSSAPIHQWIKYNNEDDNNVVTLIAEQLFTTPACFHSLCSRSSILQDYTPQILQGLLVNNADNDLKLRAVRILDLITYNPEKMDERALRLLHFYKNQASVLQKIFKNLYKVEHLLSAAGKNNFNALKHSCWKLLHAGQYSENACQLLLCTQLGQSQTLKELSITLTNQSGSILSPDYLSQIDDELLEKIPDMDLINILLQSLEGPTLNNWAKVRKTVDLQETPQLFIHQLINQTNSQAENPVLDNQVFQFIVSLRHFKKAMSGLSQEEIFWLVDTGKTEEIVQNFPDWLKQLIKNGQLDTIDRASLFSLLPREQGFLQTVYALPELQFYLPKLFIELAQKSLPAMHYPILAEQLKLFTPADRERHLADAQRQIKPESVNLDVIPVFNRMLMELDLNHGQESHRALVLGQIEFFAKLSSNSAVHKANHYQFVQEFQQVTFNSMEILRQRHTAWTSVILGSQQFSQAVNIWLTDLPEADIEHHPFTSTLLEHFDIIQNQGFMDSDCCQEFIQSLLMKPPAKITEEQYVLLFHKLTLERQKKLAVNVLQQSKLEDVQWSSLITLARVLSVQALYEIFLHSQTLFVFVDLIARHPEGIHTLAPAQIDRLLSELTSAEQLCRILNSQTQPKLKFNFVNSLFQYLQRNHLALADWLNKINAGEQALAALANYTEENACQEQLHQLIMESVSRRQQIQSFLKNPDWEMPIESAGLLNQYMRDAWLHPWKGWQCHPLLLKYLGFADEVIAMQAQMEFLEEIIKLNEFYEPLANTGNVSENTLVSARWLQRLPLIEGVLMELGEEAANPSHPLANTGFVKNIIQPLLKQGKGIAEQVINDLPKSVSELINSFDSLGQSQGLPLNALTQEQIQTIQSAWRKFKLHLTAIEYYSSPRLHALFNPESYFARITMKRISLLPKAESDALANAQTLHKEWQEQQQFLISTKFNELLDVFFRDPQILQDIKVQEWILDNCLFTQSGINIIPPLLYKLLSAVSPSLLITHLQQRENPIHAANLAKFSKLLTKYPSIQELVSVLYGMDSQSLEELLTCTRFYRLAYAPLLLSMVQKAQASGISKRQTGLVTLPESLSQNLELQWLQTEIQHLHINEERLKKHGRLIAAEALKSGHNHYDNERLAALRSPGLKLDAAELAIIFNSYAPAFNPPNEAITLEFLLSLSYLLENQQNLNLIQALNERLLQHTIRIALENPDSHYQFLNTLSHYPSSSRFCIEHIKNRLQQHLANYFPETVPVPSCVAELTAAKFGQLTRESVASLTTLQKLIFSVEPAAEFTIWRNTASADIKKDVIDFSAIASMNSILQHWKEHNNIEVSAQLTENILLVETLLSSDDETFLQRVDELCTSVYRDYPAVYFHYLALCFNRTKQPHDLLDKLKRWMLDIGEQQAEQLQWLDKLIGLLIHAGLVEEFCNELHLYPESLRQCLLISLDQKTAIDDRILTLFTPLLSWEWIKEQLLAKKTAADPAWLRTALLEKQHQQAVLEDEQSIKEFLNLLMVCQFPVDALMALSKRIDNTSLNNLLVCHLLSRADCLLQFPGQTLLDSPSLTASRPGSLRLGSLSNHIKLLLIPEASLSSLQAEAAAEILCSFRQFNHFTPEILNNLLECIAEQRSSFLLYWFKHYARLPGAQKPLIILMNILPDFAELMKQLENTIRDELLFRIIDARFKNKLPGIQQPASLTGLCSGVHLDHCIHLYLHRNQEEPALVQFIGELIYSLKEREAKLTNQSMQLLLSLYEDNHFDSLKESIIEITRTYRYSNTVFSDCSIFYDDGRINTKRMLEPVWLKAKSQGTTASSPAQRLWQTSNLPATETTESEFQSPWENKTLLSAISQTEETISFLSYFLIHFHGRPEMLQLFLEDYLDSHPQSRIPSDQQALLEKVSWLLTQPDLNKETGNVLFNCLTNYPQLLNNRIKFHLLCFNAEKYLQIPGMQKKYDELVQFCKEMKPFAKANPEVEAHLQRAKQEAKFERKLMTKSGWLLSLRLWCRRSFFYGWEGWFKPRAPRYVLPFENPVDSSRFSYQKMDVLAEGSVLPKDLEQLLKHTRQDVSPRSLNALYEALRLFEWQSLPSNELNLREQIEKTYQKLGGLMPDNPKIERWLTNHKELFIGNRHQLLCLYIQNNQLDAMQSILEQENELSSFGPVISQLKLVQDVTRKTSSGSQPAPARSASQSRSGNHLFGSGSSLPAMGDNLTATADFALS